MNSQPALSFQEYKILTRVKEYFRTSRMSLEEKLFYAKLIATLDLESGNYSADREKDRLLVFANHVDQLRRKLKNSVS
ncbi:MAG: hypothetical protein PHC60_00285 [Heliobacteriaceae bacterium]|nr:hypothetical protein [Heliobacteriaceae bacterium]